MGGIICPPPDGVILRPPSSARVKPQKNSLRASRSARNKRAWIAIHVIRNKYVPIQYFLWGGWSVRTRRTCTSTYRHLPIFFPLLSDATAVTYEFTPLVYRNICQLLLCIWSKWIINSYKHNTMAGEGFKELKPTPFGTKKPWKSEFRPSGGHQAELGVDPVTSGQWPSNGTSLDSSFSCLTRCYFCSLGCN